MTIFYLDSGGAATNSGTTDDNTAPLSGSANATILANKTFASATDVDATKRKGPSIEEIDESDPDIQRMRQAMRLRTHADQPAPKGDADLQRIYSWLNKRKI